MRVGDPIRRTIVAERCWEPNLGNGGTGGGGHI